MNLEKNKTYTRKELIEIGKDNSEIRELFGLHNVNVTFKGRINDFSEFDNETKNIYLKIAQKIKEHNINQENLFVGAIGSRIRGNWKTKEESEAIAKNLNLTKIKYSDYDCASNAKNIPDFTELKKELDIEIHLVVVNKSIIDYYKNQQHSLPILNDLRLIVIPLNLD